MNRNIGAEGHDIRRCDYCEELFCAKCSDNSRYCSELCASEHEADIREQQLMVSADNRNRARDMNAGGF